MLNLHNSLTYNNKTKFLRYIPEVIKLHLGIYSQMGSHDKFHYQVQSTGQKSMFLALLMKSSVGQQDRVHTMLSHYYCNTHSGIPMVTEMISR